MSNSTVSLDSIIDRVVIMRKQEDGPYLYSSYLQSNGKLNVSWREKITHWSYNVVDHFELSREVVAISLNLFDRYMATRGNKCNGNLALLTSLTTLHLAIKLHDTKKIRLSTLANLSRGQFVGRHIEEMEWVILGALDWKLHPPTSYSFIFHLLLFLPQEANPSIRKELFELSRYLTELAACDSFLVPFKASSIAFAAILNVMDDISYQHLPAGIRETFLSALAEKANVYASHNQVLRARERISSMFASSDLLATTVHDHGDAMTQHSQGSLSRSVDSLSPARGGMRSRTNSVDSSKGSKGSARSAYRFTPSPRSGRRIIAASSPSMGSGRARIAASPMVASIQ